MPDLLLLCLSQITWALLTWVPILTGSVLLLGVVLFAWTHHRVKRLAAAHPGAVPRLRVWTARLLVLVTQVFVLPLAALAVALPFSVQRGVADAIDSASPRILEWSVRTGAETLREKLSIDDGATIVDLGELPPVLRSAARSAPRARGLLQSLSVVPRFADSAYSDALSSAANEAAARGLRITWDDLFRSAEDRFGGLWMEQSRSAAALLRLSSLHHLSPLVCTTVLVDLSCVLLILALTRGGAGSERRLQKKR